MQQPEFGLGAQKEFTAFGIYPAGKREWIPVDGIVFPKVDRAHNLTAGLQDIAFPFVKGTEVSVRKGQEPVALSSKLYAYHKVKIIDALPYSDAIESIVPDWKERAERQKLFAVASDNDTLYEQVIVPTINEHLKNHGGQNILIPSIGYPIMDWWKKGLTDVGNSLVEADYFQLMQKGKLPDAIKAVYLDLPGTFFSNAYDPKQVRTWIEQNPDVLFVIDSANLGFQNGGVLQESLYDFQVTPPKTSNLLITTTTTKAFSTRVLAQAWVPDTFTTSHGSGQVPLTAGVSSGQLQKALQLFQPENIAQAQKLRQAIVDNREFLKQHLAQKYGENAVFNSEQTQGHALILNAQAFGYKTGQEFANALANGDFVKGAVPIGVKPTFYYTDISRNPWVNKYVYVSIPFDTQIMQDLSHALGVGGSV